MNVLIEPVNRFCHVSTLILAIFISGCATTIPETDSIAPELELTITGPVVGRQEMSNPPRDLWQPADGSQLFTLADDTEYGFTLTVSDQGGVSRANLRMPSTFIITDLAPSSVANSVVGINRSLSLDGDRSNPTTGLVITGRFRTGNEVIGFGFLSQGDDFGGRGGPTNQTFMDVNAGVDIFER